MAGDSSNLIAGGLGVVSVAISALAAWATKRSATKATSRDTEVSSRTDIEKQAFERAEKFYQGAMDRQDREIHELETKVETLETKVANQDTKIHDQDARLREQDDLIAELRRDLDVANRALRIRYPDE